MQMPWGQRNSSQPPCSAECQKTLPLEMGQGMKALLSLLGYFWLSISECPTQTGLNNEEIYYFM